MNRSRTTTALLATAFAPALLFAQRPASMPGVNSGSTSMTAAQGAETKQLPSPPAVTDTRLDGKSLTIHYNRPSMRGRTIMGGLVPYGKVWRTGANPATSFTTEANLTIGTLHVPAGKYTLYTLPAAPGTPWMLIVNKQTGQWGTEYSQAQDLGRTPMHGDKLPSPQEVMSLSFDKTAGNSTQLHMRWENTEEWVEIKAAK